ncbi:MAG: DUF2059 domain-containing protein [Caulobacter sp.]|nr:DUF2059 domain-containing protein [Caulobacter sp.]
MKRIAILAVATALSFTSGLVHAQTAGKATPETRALAQRYFEVIHYDQLLKQTMSGMIPAMTEAMRKQSPSLTAEQSQIVSEVVVEASQEVVGKLKGPMIDAMAEVFTEQELRDLVTFYESASGQALLTKSPELTKRLVVQMPTVMSDMQTSVRTKLCARLGGCDKDGRPLQKSGAKAGNS